MILRLRKYGQLLEQDKLVHLYSLADLRVVAQVMETIDSFPGQSQIGDAGSDLWKDPEVVAVNKFRNAMEGQGESFEDNNGTLVIKRGNKGVTIINWGGDKTMNVQVSMPDGTYTDQAHGGTFTVSGGKLTGSLGSGKIAAIYSPTDGSTTGGSTTGGSTTVEVQQAEVQQVEAQQVELQHQFQFLQQLFTSKSHQVGEIILMPMFIREPLHQMLNGLE